MDDDTDASIASLAALTVELAEGAAGLVRARRAQSFTYTSKSTSTDLVTEIDRDAEQWLVGEILRRRPGDAVLGEEGGDRSGPAPASGVRWLIDPIDGTVNFVLGLPQYAVSVAAELAGTVVAGAVCNPVLGETFRAVRGGGAFVGDAALTGPRDVPLERAVLATGFGYDPRLRERQVAAVAPLLPRVADIRRLGSAALDLCYLAAGRLDGYFEAGLNPWDHAAGGLIASETGCAVWGPDGLDSAPDGRLLAACRASLAPELARLLDEVGASAVR